jgi:hypothetical protein
MPVQTKNQFYETRPIYFSLHKRRVGGFAGMQVVVYDGINKSGY